MRGVDRPAGQQRDTGLAVDLDVDLPLVQRPEHEVAQDHGRGRQQDDDRGGPRACRGRRGAAPPVQGLAGRGHRPIVAGRRRRVPDPGPRAAPRVTCPDDPQPPDRSPDGCPGAAGPRRAVAPAAVARGPASAAAAVRRRARGGRPPRRPWSSSAPAASPGATCPARRRPRSGRCCSDGATASLTVRSVHSNTCPVDGWLTLSAGTGPATATPGRTPARRAGPARARPRRRRRTGLGPYRRSRGGQGLRRPHRPAGRRADPRRGLRPRGRPRRGPGAATSAGRSPATRRTTPAAARATCRPARRRWSTSARARPGRGGPADEVRPTASRAAQVRAVDARIGQVLAGRAEQRGRRRGQPLRRRCQRAAAARGAARARTRARHPGVDLDPAGRAGPAVRPHRHVLARRACPTRPPSAATRCARPAPDNSAPPRPTGCSTWSTTTRPPTRCTAWSRRSSTPGSWRRSSSTRSSPWSGGGGWGSEATRLRLLRLVRRVAIIAATVPVSTFLANLLPWWRFPSPMLAVVGSVALFVAVISAIALLGPWRRSLFGPPAGVSAATMLVLAADVMTGSRLQLSSLMGLQPVVGGRFYGMGNVTFALFATATHHAVHRGGRPLRARRPAPGGRRRGRDRPGRASSSTRSPAWGSDFGGPPAFLPALAFFVLAVPGVRLTWAARLLIGGGTVLFLLALGFADWLRPAESRSPPRPVRADRHRRRRARRSSCARPSRTGTSSPAAPLTLLVPIAPGLRHLHPGPARRPGARARCTGPTSGRRCCGPASSRCSCSSSSASPPTTPARRSRPSGPPSPCR